MLKKWATSYLQQVCTHFKTFTIPVFSPVFISGNKLLSPSLLSFHLSLPFSHPSIYPPTHPCWISQMSCNILFLLFVFSVTYLSFFTWISQAWRQLRSCQSQVESYNGLFCHMLTRHRTGIVAAREHHLLMLRSFINNSICFHLIQKLQISPSGVIFVLVQCCLLI